MRTKATLFLIVLVLSLGAVAYYIPRASVDESAKENEKLVFPVEMVNLDHLEINITNRTPPGVVLRRSTRGWELREPVRWPANFFAVNSILTQLQFLEKVNSFPVSSLAGINQTLADYGLDPDAPEGWLVLGRGETRHTVRIGKTTETGNRMYLLREGSEWIFVVPNTIRETLSLTADKLRSSAVFSMQDFEVRSWSVQLTEPSNLRVYLARDGEKWKLETPIEARADTPAVKTLLEEIVRLEVLDFVPEHADLNLLGLASADIRITLEAAGHREAVYIGDRVPGSASPERYYAKLEDTPGEDHSAVFIIAPTFLDKVRNAQLGLRERRVLDFDPAALRSLRITDSSRREITLQMLENGAWQVSSRSPGQGLVTMPGDAERITRLIQELAELSAIPDTGFVRDAALGADLESFGLTGATAWEIELTEHRTTAGATNEPRSQRLLFGRSTDDPGRPVYARLAHQGFVYLVDRAVVDDLSSRPIDYRSRQVLTLAEGPRITALTLTHLGTKDVAFSATLGPGQTWDQALAQQPTEQVKATKTLAGLLRRLRARTVESAEFTAVLPGDATGRAWTWLLQATITTEAGSTAQTTTFSLYLDAFTGGSVLLIGAPDPGLVFTAEQAFIDAFAPLVFKREDPGPPETGVEPPGPEPTPDPAAGN